MAEAKGSQGVDRGTSAVSVWASDISGEHLYVEIFTLVLNEYPMIDNIMNVFSCKIRHIFHIHQ